MRSPQCKSSGGFHPLPLTPSTSQHLQGRAGQRQTRHWVPTCSRALSSKASRFGRAGAGAGGVGRGGEAGPGATESWPGPTVWRRLPKSLESSCKNLPENPSFSGTTSVSPASSPASHSAQPHNPSHLGESKRSPRTATCPRGAGDPTPHLVQRAARGRLQESPGSMAPASPSRNFPDIALLSPAAENDASRRRRRRRGWRQRRREQEQKVRSIAESAAASLSAEGLPPPG